MAAQHSDPTIGRTHSPFLDHLPGQSAAAATLITNENGASLLLRTHNRDALVLPGGVVEPGESPAAAAEREVHEEVGLAQRPTRLLVVQHKPATTNCPASLMFIFDTERVPSPIDLTLQQEEVADVFWLDPPTAVREHTEGGRSRLAAAFRAKAEGLTIYLDADRTLEF